MKLREMTSSGLACDASVKIYEAINNNGISPAHKQSIALVSFEGSHSTVKKHIEDHAIAHFSPYVVIFSLRNQREPSKLAFFIFWPNYRRKAYPLSLDDNIVPPPPMIVGPIASSDFRGLSGGSLGH